MNMEHSLVREEWNNYIKKKKKLYEKSKYIL